MRFFLMWMASFLSEVSLPQNGPSPLLGDNLGAIALTKTTKGHKLSKHLDICHHLICDMVEENKISVTPIRMPDSLADLMTKPLPKVTHNHFVQMLNLIWKRRSREGEC